MRYDHPEANEWVTPVRRNYKLACCDCGLVHDVDFRIVAFGSKRRIQFRVRLNNRASAGIRMAMGLRLKKDGGYRYLKKFDRRPDE